MSNKITIVMSAFPACGKSYTYNNFNGKPFTMLDSDSSKFSWLYDENGNKTDIRNPNFINDYMKHVKENIGKVDIIFVSSHSDVRKALRDNHIKYFMVYPSLDMKDMMLERMVNRGNNEKFINFQKEHYEQFVKEIVEECKKFSGTGYKNGHYTPNACLGLPLTKENSYIDNHLIDECLDNSMGNLSCLWWNY